MGERRYTRDRRAEAVRVHGGGHSTTSDGHFRQGWWRGNVYRLQLEGCRVVPMRNAGLVAVDERQDRAVVLSALGLKSTAVQVWLAKAGRLAFPWGIRYQVGLLTKRERALEIPLLEIGEGNPPLAAFTAQALAGRNPDALLFVGIPGCLVDSVRPEDMVAPCRGTPIMAANFVRSRLDGPTDDLLVSTMLDQVADQSRRKRRWVARLTTTISMA